jgi:23S rRNA (uracil1939-C5)-methyltransferase
LASDKIFIPLLFVGNLKNRLLAPFIKQNSLLNVQTVSCNPTKQERNIKLMGEVGYKLTKIGPLDMFPHTFHIENLALMKK